MTYTRGFHPRRKGKLTKVRSHGRSGCSTSAALPMKITMEAAVAARIIGLDDRGIDAFVAQHHRQCPARWQEGQQLETPLRDGLTHEALLWVASKCRGGRLHTVVFVPGEEPF